MSERPTYELLRDLLPRYYWLRDAETGGGVLEAVVRSIAAQFDELHADLDRLYDDFFIATCEPRFVALIGDGIGVEGLAASEGPGVSDRAWVGRVIGLRRRKGLPATLARGATAATGWPSFVREGRPATSVTQAMGDPLVAERGFADLAGRRPASRFGDPWSQAPRGAAISGRPIVAGEHATAATAATAGHPAPACAALWIWRLRSYAVRGATARAASDAPARHAGRAFRFHPLGRDTRLFAAGAVADDVRDAPATAELPLALTNDLLDAALLHAQRTGAPPPVRIAGARRIVAGDLGAWQTTGDLARADAVVDPLRGRLLLLTGERPARLAVDYAYGFPGELGGGSYGFEAQYAPAPALATPLLVDADDPACPTIALAVAQAAGGSAAIVIADSTTRAGDLRLTVAPGAELRIAAAPGAAPVLDGAVRARIGTGGRLELVGLTIAGEVRVDGDGELAVEHCTLAPRDGQPSLAGSGRMAVRLTFAISGAIELRDDAHLAIRSSIVDGAVAAGGVLDAAHVTALGPVAADTLLARDCIFAEPAAAGGGVVATSYVAGGSQLPQLLQCAAAPDGPPRFTSTRWGDPAYGQLHRTCPPAIAAGASRGREMGAYNWLGQPERLARLPYVLQELMPAGIGATVEFVT